MDAKHNQTGWRFKIHEQTITEVIKRYEKNRRFDQNLVAMFDYLMGACRLLWNRENAVHIFTIP